MFIIHKFHSIAVIKQQLNQQVMNLGNDKPKRVDFAKGFYYSLALVEPEKAEWDQAYISQAYTHEEVDSKNVLAEFVDQNLELLSDPEYCVYGILLPDNGPYGYALHIMKLNGDLEEEVLV